MKNLDGSSIRWLVKMMQTLSYPGRASRLTVLVASMLVVSTVVTAADWLGDFPVPVTANLETVSLQMRHNGHLVDMARFESADSVADTLAFYRSLWGEPNAQDESSPPVWLSSEVGGRVYISRLYDGLSQVLDLDNASKDTSSGILSVMTIDSDDGVKQGDYLLSDGELLSLTQTSDRGVGYSTLLMARYMRSPERVAEGYREHFVSRGWKAGMRQDSDSSVLLSFSNDGKRDLSVVITAAPDGGTHAVLNEIER
ncbi:hypothetical protein [Granulosicoccus antarcticus]|uniref:Uncharacterized protein n=1 Tax=Granulosicoccus antarcticus IMCC3135 TaxID=1192854 RepID=A0A2Z2NLB3_9GAMM|nr:hypothetical protein [Granulosicoccus antarcticus]ASJ71943.1 hypothetical protein IMCC3135_09230 [Granulosicoccus antarcticus IMCC3135]